MLPDNIEHCIVFMNYWGVSGVFWSFSKCNITIPHFPTGDSTCARHGSMHQSFPAKRAFIYLIRSMTVEDHFTSHIQYGITHWAPLLDRADNRPQTSTVNAATHQRSATDSPHCTLARRRRR